MKEILSVQNKQIKEFKKLHKKKYREKTKKYIIEGFHLVEEAKKSKQNIQAILFNQRAKKEWQEWLEQQKQEILFLVSDEVIKDLSELPTPPGILAILVMNTPLQVENLDGRWLLLDNVQDPGNVGTMIRTADAAGLTGVILGDGSADLYGSKVLRAMQGSNYHLPVLRYSLHEIVHEFQRKNIPVYGTELNKQALVYSEAQPTNKFALIMGNEGVGVSRSLLRETTQNLYIPLLGASESLNVAVASGVILFHLVHR